MSRPPDPNASPRRGDPFAPPDPTGPDPLAHLYAGPGEMTAPVGRPWADDPRRADPYADLTPPGIPAYALVPTRGGAETRTAGGAESPPAPERPGVPAVALSGREEHPLAERVVLFGWLGLAISITGPLAWYWGNRARRDFRREPGRYRTVEVNIGWMLGILQTVGLVLAMALFAFLLIVAAG